MVMCMALTMRRELMLVKSLILKFLIFCLIYFCFILKLKIDKDILDIFDDIMNNKPKLFIFQACRGGI